MSEFEQESTAGLFTFGDTSEHRERKNNLRHDDDDYEDDEEEEDDDEAAGLVDWEEIRRRLRQGRGWGGRTETE